MNAYPFGQPFTAPNNQILNLFSKYRYSQLTNPPSAKLASFLNSFGVAIGRAIITAKQILHEKKNDL